MNNQATKQVKKARNPTGKGGFGDHPENQSPGGWSSKNTFSYQMNRFKNMTVEEFRTWPENNPEDIRTMAEELAFQRVFSSRIDLNNFKEVANRTEGMPKMEIENSGSLDLLHIYKPEKNKV